MRELADPAGLRREAATPKDSKSKTCFQRSIW
jgi:hypothetical protein